MHQKTIKLKTVPVTINDYIRLVQRDYPAAESVIAWGGEENDPPVYGRVYLAIKPTSGLTVISYYKKFYQK